MLRALCFYLDCPSNDFADPDCLRANGTGMRLLPREFPVSKSTVPVEVSITPLPEASAGQIPVRLVLVRGGSNPCRWNVIVVREVPNGPYILYGPSKVVLVGEKYLSEGLAQYQG